MDDLQRNYATYAKHAQETFTTDAEAAQVTFAADADSALETFTANAERAQETFTANADRAQEKFKANAEQSQAAFDRLRTSLEASGTGSTSRNSRASEGTSSKRLRQSATPVDVDRWEITYKDILLGPRIGVGSYAEVYRGTWKHMDVAVKRLFDQQMSEKTLEAFKGEVAIVKRLKHPNITLFLGACTVAPNLCIVTEYLPRGSLFDMLHRQTSVHLDMRGRVRIALDVARAMHYLHSYQPAIVHRDLKSSNLLMTASFNAKVCDFGLSCVQHTPFISSKSQVGTPGWMAPEVLRNERISEKSDVFSFGVVLWELLTGQIPWEGMTAVQIIRAVGWDDAQLDIPDGPQELVHLLQTCFGCAEERPAFDLVIRVLKEHHSSLAIPLRFGAKSV
ncbi:hypothetical protein WJX72_004440 [[Myrmecia] bisecta]|uniref:non-specific serine/threonine protein kinase n=1 Tax=[Myrmecia] bisecta TaxID=41462 RepID=A0AAW1PJN6_9CHLO